MRNGADGILIISYKSRIRRFRGGAVTKEGGMVLHTFGPGPGVLKPRWPWRLWTCKIEYFAVGGAGGDGYLSRGEPGKSVVGHTIPTDVLHVNVGKGGARGGYNGGTTEVDLSKHDGRE